MARGARAAIVDGGAMMRINSVAGLRRGRDEDKISKLHHAPHWPRLAGNELELDRAGLDDDPHRANIRSGFDPREFHTRLTDHQRMIRHQASAVRDQNLAHQNPISGDREGPRAWPAKHGLHRTKPARTGNVQARDDARQRGPRAS